MGVDYFPCGNCKKTVCDRGDYYTCEGCGNMYCVECGESGKAVFRRMVDEETFNSVEELRYYECIKCTNYVPSRIFSKGKMLKWCLRRLEITPDQVIEGLKEELWEDGGFEYICTECGYQCDKLEYQKRAGICCYCDCKSSIQVVKLEMCGPCNVKHTCQG